MEVGWTEDVWSWSRKSVKLLDWLKSQQQERWLSVWQAYVVVSFLMW